MLPFPAAWTYQEGLPLKTGIPGFWNNAVLVSGKTGGDTVYSSTARYRQEEPESVSGSCTGTSRYTGMPERPGYGVEAEDEAHSQGRQGLRGVSMPLYHRLSQQISQLYRYVFFISPMGKSVI